MTDNNQQQPRKRFFEREVSARTALAILVTVVMIAVVIVFAIPRTQEPAPQFEIASKSDWWTKEEIPDGIGGDSVLHVKVSIKNSGNAAGVILLHVKVEEPGGRFWQRFRFVSVSPGDTVEEQVDFPEVEDENVEVTAWLTRP